MAHGQNLVKVNGKHDKPTKYKRKTQQQKQSRVKKKKKEIYVEVGNDYQCITKEEYVCPATPDPGSNTSIILWRENTTATNDASKGYPGGETVFSGKGRASMRLTETSNSPTQVENPAGMGNKAG